MDLNGSDMNTACNAIIGAMFKAGYLTNTSNSILVSVRSHDGTRGKALEQTLSKNLNAPLEDSDLTPAVLGKYIEDDPELESFARQHNISISKAWLIRSLLATGSTHMTKDSLLSLSTQELLMLAFQREVDHDASYGTADTSKYIGPDKAISIALRHAGISRQQAQDLEAQYDCEDGTIIYEVEFTASGQDFEYDIDALTGTLLETDDLQSDSDREGDDRDDSGDDDNGDDDDGDDEDDDNDDDHDDDDDR
jgi:uncharacterized membrane protein YkoI